MEDQTPVATATPTPVPAQTPAPAPAKSGGSRTLVVVIILLLLLCCCCSTLGGAYAFLKAADLNLNGKCYKGLDGLTAGQTVPCPGQATTNNPSTQTQPVPSQAGTTETYAGDEYYFEYPADWTVEFGSDNEVFVTTPEGGYLTFNASVEETGTLTDQSCEDFALTSLDTVQLDINPLAELVYTEQVSVGGYDACVFDVESASGGETTLLRYIYIVEDGRGYLIELEAAENSTLRSDMTNVAESVILY
jgi:hypothetical protein